MKKLCCFFLVLILLQASVSSLAFAEPDLTAYSVASGTVSASAFDDLTAPCSGVLTSFDLEAGDAVTAGQELFTMLTTVITAPEDGTVRYLFAAEGDSADQTVSRYGAVLAMEPSNALRLSCTYSGAADYEECRHLHIGEKLYFKLDKEKGTGVVISAWDGGYEVEVLTGEYDSGKTMDLFKDSDYAYDNKTGSGKVIKRDDLLIPASGVIAEIMVSPGEAVKKGDALFSVLSPDADFGASPSVAAPSDGVLASVPVASGQQVWKGQVLARLLRTDSLEVVADVDEMDLHALKVGDTVPVTLDTDESKVLTGTVTEISSLGIPKLNAAYFTVHVSLDEKNVKLGQSASVYIP